MQPVEARLADTLGVSRTPLREALQRLEAESMVVRAGRAYVVLRVDLGEWLKSPKVRIAAHPERAVQGLRRRSTAAASWSIDGRWLRDAARRPGPVAGQGGR